MTPVLHFGYFDHPALAHGRLCDCREPVVDRLASDLCELFGPLPGRDMPGLGFFDYYGVLSCECPSVFGSVRLPVDLVAELVDRSGCDVVYAYNGEFRLVSRAGLPAFLDPERIPREEVGLAEPGAAPDAADT
jgi:hypothetical protein